MQPSVHLNLHPVSSASDVDSYAVLMQAVQLGNQAHVLKSQGDYMGAIKLLLMAVPLKVQARGSDSVEVGVSWQNLADACIAANKLEEAKEALDEAFRIRCTLNKGPDMDKAATRESLGLYWEMKHNASEARKVRLLGEKKGMLCAYENVRIFHYLECDKR